MYITSYIKPFDVKQKVYVIGDNEEILEENLTTLCDFHKVVLNFCSDFNVDEVDLYGNTSYCEKLVENIRKEEMSKFNKNILKIELKGV